MDMEEIRKELKIVLEDMDSWCGQKERPPEREVRRRELVLWKQAILYKIEGAKKSGNKRMEDFNTELLCVLNCFLGMTYSQTEFGKRFMIKLYEDAVKMGDERMVNFCKEIFDVYDKYGVDSHIRRPNAE
jgi:hypothetical protein